MLAPFSYFFFSDPLIMESLSFIHPGALEAVDGWHATSAEEAHDIRQLGFEQPVDAAQLLLFAELETVAHKLRLAILTMLSGNKVALFDSALLAVTALTLEK